MKLGGILAIREMERRGLPYRLLGQIHDEYQFETLPEYAEEVGQVIVDGFRRAGEMFKFRIPIAGEYKIGPTWAETH